MDFKKNHESAINSRIFAEKHTNRNFPRSVVLSFFGYSISRPLQDRLLTLKIIIHNTNYTVTLFFATQNLIFHIDIFHVLYVIYMYTLFIPSLYVNLSNTICTFSFFIHHSPCI